MGDVEQLRDLSEWKFDDNMYLWVLENYIQKIAYNSLKMIIYRIF